MYPVRHPVMCGHGAQMSEDPGYGERREGHACASEDTSGMEMCACCLVGRPSAAPAPATAADNTALIC